MQCEQFFAGQLLGALGETVEPGFLVDEHFPVQLPVPLIIKQSDWNGVERLFAQAVKQVGAALLAEAALGPV